MQYRNYIWGLLLAVVLIAPAAMAQINARPIDDFLDAQGMSTSFVPPVADYIGWSDVDFVNFALVDYAGIAADFIEAETGLSIGTAITGQVTEQVLADGRLKVRIRLDTTNALAWAFELANADLSDPLVFLNTPLAFGRRAQDVVDDDAQPALAEVKFRLEYIDEAPQDQPLPDLIQLLFNPTPAQVVTLIDFQARADGPLHEGFNEVPEGTPGRLVVKQKCEKQGGDLPCVFTKEVVDILVLSN